MKVLFLPFLQMNTGHHTVADALIRSLEQRILNIECRKIDFFSYADKLLEKAFRVTYLTWIDHAPQSFELLYRYFVYPSKASRHFNWFEVKFLDKMKALIDEEQPDLIVCTQAFPSYLISRLRSSGVSTPPVINVYTDFFINKLWGIQGIDYHFVPNQEIGSFLINNHGVSPGGIFVTGIPIDECFIAGAFRQPEPPYNILISGGSGGLGDIESLISSLDEDLNYCYSILCGQNSKLYKEIVSLNRSNVNLYLIFPPGRR
jgi:UDP-N-acetylglucosamine:LPS N-acetylglucosamine transferase